MKKRLVSLLYVAIAFSLVGQAAGAAQTYVDWFSTFRALELGVDGVVITRSENKIEATIKAVLRNPTGFGGVRLQSVVYSLYVNSTRENFFVGPTVQLESEAGEFGFKTAPLDKAAVPAHGSLNLTFTIQAHEDIGPTLRSFLDSYSEHLRFFVGMTLGFPSYYGSLRVPYCYMLPEHELTVCPTPRPLQPPPSL